MSHILYAFVKPFCQVEVDLWEESEESLLLLQKHFNLNLEDVEDGHLQHGPRRVGVPRSDSLRTGSERSSLPEEGTSSLCPLNSTRAEERAESQESMSQQMSLYDGIVAMKPFGSLLQSNLCQLHVKYMLLLTRFEPGRVAAEESGRGRCQRCVDCFVGCVPTASSWPSSTQPTEQQLLLICTSWSSTTCFRRAELSYVATFCFISDFLSSF